MFVKLYKYRVRKRDFQKWQKINKAVVRVYKKYGGGNCERLVTKKGSLPEIIELDRYKSKSDFLKIMKKVNTDHRTDALYKEFESLVYGKMLVDEFETI